MRSDPLPKEQDSVIGCVLGTAVGDALGLPFEGLSKRRQRGLHWDLNKFHFFLGRGMTSDDTEHTCMVAQALIVSGGDVETFESELCWQFRWWLLGLPASTGLATLKAVLKLWVGFPSHRSGVFSAGNGPAMRSPIIGVCYGHDAAKLRELVRASARITHTDPKAEYGALAVAVAAYLSSKQSVGDVATERFTQILQAVLPAEAESFLALVQNVARSIAAGRTTESFATELGLENGVSGYVYHTVPVAIHSWLRHQRDYRSGIVEAIGCGGDTDSTAAIVGGIIGARVGGAGIPSELLDGLWEWPRSVQWMEELGKRLAAASHDGLTQQALPVSQYKVFLRNLFFILLVLLHGVRRLLPPYR